MDKLETLQRSLEKAVGENKPGLAARSLRSLIGIQVTKSMLKKTGAGLSVSKLRSHSNPEIADLANNVLEKWKKDVGVIKPVVSEAVSKKSVPEVVRNVTTDTPKFVDLKDTIRNKCVEMLYNSLCFDSTEDVSDLSQKAQEIERELFKKYSSTSETYRNHVRTLYSNLRNKWNSTLRSSIMNDTIPVPQLVTMNSAEIAPPELKQEMEEMKKTNMFLARAAGNIKAETDQFRCGKCKKRRTSYYQMQTRSADEPMTTFVECLECGNRWKFC